MEYVKDTNNLLDYNIWSAGEYNNNLNNISYSKTLITLNISNEYSIIGENSINLRNTEAAFVKLSDREYSINTVLTAKAHIKCVKGSVRLRIDDAASILVSITIPENTVGEFTISGTVPSTGKWRLQLVPYANNESFIDNINLTAS